jgi:hypothetical protein
VKRAEMIRGIGAAARRAGVEWRLMREGREHELWQCGPIGVAVPRHREIGAKTARRIMADLEPILGRRWWQG